MRTRRSILALLGSGLSLSTAGCAELPTGLFDPGLKLDRVNVTNLGDSPQRFGVRVERSDTEVHRSTHTLERDGGSVVGTARTCSWMETASSYSVAARIGDGEWTTRSVSEGVSGNPEYARVWVIYDGWNRERIVFVIQAGREADSRSEGDCQLPTTGSSE